MTAGGSGNVFRRKNYMYELTEICAQHTGIQGGLSEYDPGQTPNCRTVFEQADAQMYEEKKPLKSPSAVTQI